jgi:septin family protein
MPEKKEILGNIETSFRALLCGCSGQGKSTLIRNMLMDPSYNLVDKKFKADCVFIFTPTLDLDDSWIDIVKFLESKSTPEHEFKRN